ncbi:hypothetical protein DFH09DRAFT_967482, partial [Mycena vulgaris]
MSMSTDLVNLSSTRSREFIFEDGDIVLECPEANGSRFLYRVHKFILTQHSAIFADMFKPEVLAAQSLRTLDGLPVVPLPEPAAEIYKLLSCLYNALNGGAFHDPQRPIARYDWLFKICDKYQIAPLRQCIITQLKSEWPATLAEWDAREAHIAALRQQHIRAGPSGRVHNMYLDDRLTEPIMCITLAHMHSLPELLPAAFYDLARRDPRADWDAFHDAATRNLPANERMLAQGVRSARWSTLAAPHLLIFAMAKERQLQFVRDVMGLMCNVPLPHPLCTVARDKLVDRAQEIAVLSRDPLLAAQWGCKQASIADTGICPPCAAHTSHVFAFFRGQYWRALPKIF